jgi:hypothetical protein
MAVLRKKSARPIKLPKTESEPKPEKKAKSKKTRTDKSVKNSNTGTGNSANNQVVNVNIHPAAQFKKAETNEKDDQDDKDMEAAGTALKEAFKRFNLAKQAAIDAKVTLPKSLTDTNITEENVDTVGEIRALTRELEIRTEKILSLVRAAGAKQATGQATNLRSAGLFPTGIRGQTLQPTGKQLPGAPGSGNVATHPDLTDDAINQQLQDLEDATGGGTGDTTQLTMAQLLAQAQAANLQGDTATQDTGTLSDEFKQVIRQFIQERRDVANQNMSSPDDFNTAYAGVVADLEIYYESLEDEDERRVAKNLLEVFTQDLSTGLSPADILGEDLGPIVDIEYATGSGGEDSGGADTGGQNFPQYPAIETRANVLAYRNDVWQFIVSNEWNTLGPEKQDLVLIEYNMASKYLAGQVPIQSDINTLSALSKPALINMAIRTMVPLPMPGPPNVTNWSKVSKANIVMAILEHANQALTDESMTLEQ